METCLFFFLNFKGAPSQEEHNTILSSLSELNWLCLVKVPLWCYFQQSAILSVTLTLTFRSLPVLESKFSKSWWLKAIVLVKSNGGLLYSGIDEIPVSHIPEREKFRKSIWSDKAISSICKQLKMVVCPYCDGVPLKLKFKNLLGL